MSRGVDSNKDDAAAKLQQMIDAYNQSGNRENESARIESLSQARHNAKLDNDRQSLLKNGVPIDPELIEQVTGGDRSSITIPKVDLNDDDSMKDGSDRSGKATSGRKTANGGKGVLTTSSGETIHTDKATVSRHDQKAEPVDIKPDDSRVYSRQAARNDKREVRRVLRQARHRYGHETYNRLDPTSYTQEQETARRKKRLARRVIIISVVVVVLIGIACGIGFFLYKQANPTLEYAINYCTEQDVINAIHNYKDGNVQPITSYLDGKVGDEQYSQDAKCAYIGALEFAMNGIESGVDYQLTRFDSSVDKDTVKKLIERCDGPAAESLQNSSSDELDNVNTEDPGQDGTLLEEPIYDDVPN